MTWILPDLHRLALFNHRNYDLHLSNPIIDPHIKLHRYPCLRRCPPVVDERFILSSSPEQERCHAFTTVGGSRVALCPPCRNNERTFLSGGDRAYEDLVYSSIHNHLFCVTGGNTILVSWETSDESESPRLDWAIEGKNELNFSV